MDLAVDVAVDVLVDRPGVDVPHDGGTAPPDAMGPVGVYDFADVRAEPTMAAPVAAAWHPSGRYALILSASNYVYRYDAVARAITRVATAGSDVNWRMAAFTPDGTRALLIGTTYVGTSTRHGRLFVWSDAASTVTEQTAETWLSGAYQSIRFASDGSRAALLGQGSPSSVTTLWLVSPAGHRTGIAGARGMPSGLGCDDLASVADGFGDPALDVVCGTGTGEIVRVSNLGPSSVFTTLASAGAVGNTSRIAARADGTLALAVGWAGQRLYRMRNGVWETGFSTPTVLRGFGVSFNDIASRAFAFGGAGYLYEYRTDLFTTSDITTSQIPIDGTPWLQPSNAVLNDVAWRPGCDEGLAVGGANTFSGTTAFVAYFRALNGRMCP